MISKGMQTSVQQSQQAEEQGSSPPTTLSTEDTSASKSLWRMFSEDWLPASIVPSNILGVPVTDIQSDLREGTTQISEL